MYIQGGAKMQDVNNSYHNIMQNLAKESLLGTAKFIVLAGNISNKEAVDLLNHYLATESTLLHKTPEKAAIALGVTGKTVREHSKKPRIETYEDLVEMGYKIFDNAPPFGLTKEEFEIRLAEKYREIRNKEIGIEQDIAGYVLDVLETLGKVKSTERKTYIPLETDKYEKLTELGAIIKNIIEGYKVLTEATYLKIHKLGIRGEKESEALHANVGGLIRWTEINEFKESVTNYILKLVKVFEQRAMKDLTNSVKYVIQLSGFPKNERLNLENKKRGSRGKKGGDTQEKNKFLKPG